MIERKYWAEDHRVEHGCVAKTKLICYSGEKRAKEVSIMSNHSPNPFKWCHFQPDIILLCVRWYLRYSRELSGPRRNDVGARAACGSYHDLSLGKAGMPLSWNGVVVLI